MEIKCALCGETVEVAESIVPGQHVRCPFCGGKFSYGIENKSELCVGDVERKKVVKSAKYTKAKMREARSRMDGRAEALAKRKTIVVVAIASLAVIVIALLASFSYLNWHEEKANTDRRMVAEKTRRDAIVAEKNQRREKLSQYISGQLKDLRRKKSDVVFELNGVSRKMRDKRDAGEDVNLLKSQKEALRIKQDVIQGVLNAFLTADMRIDAMDLAEIDNTERELTQKMHDLALALEASAKQETETKQEILDKIKIQDMSHLNNAGAVLGDSLVSTGGGGEEFKKLDSETKKLVMSEEKHDIEMQNRKQLMVESQEAVATEPKNDQSIISSDNCAETTTSNVTMTTAEVGVRENGKPKVAEKPKLRKCHKCFGKGSIVETVNEKCDDCEGRGYIVKEVVLKDTKHYTDGHWNYKRVGNRMSKNRQNCSRCNHRGKITVKREKKCPTCKGCGFFTKDGTPYEEPPVEVTDDAAEEVSKWLIPTAENGGAIWHYTKFEPEHSWFKINYDHSKWFDGRSAFSGQTKNLNTGTEWNSKDIYLRKKFRFDGNPARIKTAKLRYTIDDILHVWLNESKIAEQSGVDERYREIDVTTEFVSCLRRGENVIAVWAHDVGGRRNVDVGLFVTYQKDE